MGRMELLLTAWLGWLAQHTGLGVKALVGAGCAHFERSLPAFRKPASGSLAAGHGRIYLNTSIFVLWTIAISLFSVAAAYALQQTSFGKVGLLRQLVLPDGVQALFGVVLLDLSSYFIHRIEHATPLLWRFHKLHHQDEHVDVSTALRKHPVSGLFNGISFLGVIVVLGIPPASVVAYNLVADGVGFLGHSSLAFPAAFTRTLRAFLLISPDDHRLHHSAWHVETDSNFGQITSFWDRLFGTYRRRSDYRDFSFGVDEDGDLPSKAAACEVALSHRQTYLQTTSEF